MKNGKSPTQGELNYTVRRVVYNALVLATSLNSITNSRTKFADRQSAKIAALIMLRNLDAFLFDKYYSKSDDINISDFNVPNWKPKKSTKLKSKDKIRIHKIAGHIVASKPVPFNNNGEIETISKPILEQTCQFLNECMSQRIAKYTGNASKYAKKLNSILPKLGMKKLDI